MYTSSLVTLVNANGAQRGPYIFTYDPAFDPKGPLWKDVIKICKEYKLSPNEIFYVYDEKKQYFKEDRVMIDNVMRVSKPWEGQFFRSDKGNSFSSKGESVILDNGAEMHEVFDPPIHGKLSINDAHLHPIGKNDWVNNRREEWPQWRDLLYLAYAISTVPAQSTKKAWDKHFFLDRTPTVQLVDEMLWGPVSSRYPEKEKRHGFCKEAYEKFLAEGSEIDTEPPAEIPRMLDSAFDGPYWDEY